MTAALPSRPPRPNPPPLLPQNGIGAVPSPMDCYLALRGLKTLHLRMERHAANAQALAEALEAHPAVERVRRRRKEGVYVPAACYPAPRSFFPPTGALPRPRVPPTARARRAADPRAQRHGDLLRARGPAGCARLPGEHQSKGEPIPLFPLLAPEAALTLLLLRPLQLFLCAESLGAVESLAESPAIMTHASVPPEQRARLGISDSLVRLSVGVEDLADLREDLLQALAKAQAAAAAVAAAPVVASSPPA